MERPPVNVKGRVVVITGAARGLGRAYAEGFLKEGARVVATDLSWNGAEDFERELNASKDALTGVMDVRNDSQVEALYKDTIDKFGTVDALINNAGMRQRDLYPPAGRVTTLEAKPADFERMYAVNVFGTLRVTQQFIKPMIEKRRGSIVSVASSGSAIDSGGSGVWTALRPNSREQPYMSSKSALMNWALYLADEVKELNIAVNVIFPGHTRTTGSAEQELARRAMGQRGGPIPLDPEHAVPLVIYLAQQDASGETGKVFDTTRWLQDHGYDVEQWRHPLPD
ncbi:MAG TPA: SDR family oxidoreductase [Dehalococcoidia bacterium]|nr:SDR family oxidoreductase [Dehalococcoidia bacterium]